ncbi:MAG: OFA family MFS transporter [Eggerthellaceae bacterium]
MATKVYRRVIVLVAASLCCGATGCVYMWSIFNKPLMAAHGWAQADVALAYSLYLVMVCLMGFICGWMQTKMSPKKLVLIAGTLFGGGWILTAFANSLPMLYLSFSVIAGAGNGFIYNTSVTVAQKWYPDRRGLASGLCIGLAGLAPVVFAPLGNYFIAAFDVSTAFILVGVIILVLYWVFAQFLKLPEPGWKPEGWEPPASLGAANCLSDLKTTTMLRQPLFWVMWLTLCAACTSGTMMTGNASNIGQDLAGLTAAQGAMQVGIFAVGGFCGRFGFASLSDKIGRHNTFLIMLGANAVVMLFFLNGARDFLSFTVCLVIIGACFGGSMATMASLCGDNFGTANYGQNYAFVYSGFTMSSFTGSWCAALCMQLTGTYFASFMVAGFLSAAGFLLVFLMKHLEKKLKAKNIHEVELPAASDK